MCVYDPAKDIAGSIYAQPHTGGIVGSLSRLSEVLINKTLSFLSLLGMKLPVLDPDACKEQDPDSGRA